MQHEKKTYDILVKQLGEEDSRTKDSQNWMKTFKMRELQVIPYLLHFAHIFMRFVLLHKGIVWFSVSIPVSGFKN